MTYALRYTPEDGSETTHQLTIPIWRLRPARRKRRFSARSVTRDNDFVWSLGSGVHELTAEVRFDEDPADLLDLLEAGADGRKITLDSDLSDTSTNTNFPSRVINIENKARIRPEEDRVAHQGTGNYRVELTLRHDSTGTYQGIFEPGGGVQ